jgi:flagellar assembly protein FliH
MHMKLEPLILKPLAGALDAAGVVGGRAFVPANKKAEQAPPPPSFSEADMKVAEREGYQKGFIEGIKEGIQQSQNTQNDINKQLLAMSEQFNAAISPMLEHYQTMAAELHSRITPTALAIAKKVAGDALDEKAAEHVGVLATHYCEMLFNEPQVLITVQESLGDTLEKLLQSVASRLPDSTHIVIVRDPDMPKSDCRIEWKFGSISHSTEEIWQRVEKVLENTNTISSREHAQDMQQLQANVGAPSASKAEEEAPEPTDTTPPTQES